MKAAVFRGAGVPLVVETVDDPTPGPGEAVIRVQRCGVCGTDLHMTSGHGNDAAVGSVIGHEYCGEVVAFGTGVERLRPGQFVTAMPVAGCGGCAPCLDGYPMACQRMVGMVGGFGEYMRIAAGSAIVLPETLGPADGALVEPLAVGLRGVRLAGLRPGARVAVLGAGSIGLAVIYWARLLGAGKVAALSRSLRRAELAGQMGADAFVVLGEGEGGGESERLVAALGGMPEVVFECTGAVGMTQKAVELVGPAGQVISLGFCTAPDPFLPSLATWKQVTMRFSFAYDLREFEHSAAMLDAGRVEPRLMISRTVPLADFPAVLESLRAGANETKVHVDPWARA